MIKEVFKGVSKTSNGEKGIFSACSCKCGTASTEGITDQNFRDSGGQGGCQCTCWCQQGQANSQRNDNTSEASYEAG